MNSSHTLQSATRQVTAALALAAASTFTPNVIAADLTVTIADVEKPEGEIMLAIYDSKDNFRKIESIATRKAATQGDMVFSFPDLVAGNYAVMVFHDCNSNGELDTNLLGIPKEPWGGSLQGKSVFGAPGWSDVQFEIMDEGTSITIKLR